MRLYSIISSMLVFFFVWWETAFSSNFLCILGAACFLFFSFLWCYVVFSCILTRVVHFSSCLLSDFPVTLAYKASKCWDVFHCFFHFRFNEASLCFFHCCMKTHMLESSDFLFQFISWATPFESFPFSLPLTREKHHALSLSTRWSPENKSPVKSVVTCICHPHATHLNCFWIFELTFSQG